MNSMTECEAIENLKNLFSNYELTLPNTDSLETLQFTIKALEEIREYRRLEEQGMLLKLPCEVGNTVYVVATCKDFGKVLDGTLWDAGVGFGTATGYYCPYELNDSCPHEEGFEECEGGCECFENKLAVFEDCIECIAVYEENNSVFLINCGSVSFEDFGKTVFLTREEAEAALERMREDE